MPFCAKHVRVWECEIVRLGFESDFCQILPNAPILLPSISNFLSQRKRSENHTQFCAKHERVWECEIVRLGFESDFCLTLSNAPILLPSISNFSSRRKRSENHTPFCAKHVKVWECEIVRMWFESDFCLTLSNAPIFLTSISNFMFRLKHWESHMQFCGKHVRVWKKRDCAILEWFLFYFVLCSNCVCQYLKCFVFKEACRKMYAIFCQTSENVRKWDCLTGIWEWFLSDLS